jgi:hypothetical protein
LKLAKEKMRKDEEQRNKLRNESTALIRSLQTEAEHGIIFLSKFSIS